MNSKPIRSFFALNIPVNSLEQIDKELKILKKSISNQVKWVSTSAMHITLKFIRDFNPDHIPGIEKDLVMQLTRFGKIEFSFENTGVFPTPRNPRIIWLGLKGADRIGDLSKIVDHTLSKSGYLKEERYFNPHLTIGRVRNDVKFEQKSKIGQKAINYVIQPIGPITIEKMSFIKSDLFRSGAVYTNLFDINLL